MKAAPCTSVVRRSGGLGITRNRARRFCPCCRSRAPAATACAAVRNVGPRCFAGCFGFSPAPQSASAHACCWPLVAEASSPARTSSASANSSSSELFSESCATAPPCASDCFAGGSVATPLCPSLSLSIPPAHHAHSRTARMKTGRRKGRERHTERLCRDSRKREQLDGCVSLSTECRHYPSTRISTAPHPPPNPHTHTRHARMERGPGQGQGRSAHLHLLRQLSRPAMRTGGAPPTGATGL